MSAKESFIVNKSYDPLILRTVLRRNWWWPLLFIFVMTLIGFFYLRYTKPTYESSLVLQLSDEDNAKSVLNIENINTQTNQLSSSVELLRSELLFEQAIASLNMNVSLFSRGKILTEEKYLSSTFNVQPYALNDSSLVNKEILVSFDGNEVTLSYNKNGENRTVQGKLGEHLVTNDFDIVVKATNDDSFKEASVENELYFVFNSDKSLASRLIGGLNVQPIDNNAKTIAVSYQGYNPKLCHDVALAVGREYVNFDENSKKRVSAKIIGFINRQLDSLERELRVSKDSLIDFQRRANIVDPENSEMTLNEKINSMQAELLTINEELRSLNHVSETLNSHPNRLDVYRLFPEMFGKSFEPALASRVEELHTLLVQKEDLLFEVTEENSKVKMIDQKIEAKNQMIQRSIATILERLKENADVLKIKISQIESSKFELPEKQMEYTRLKKIQDLNEKYVNQFTERKVLYSISDAGYTSWTRILRKPSVNETPVAPNGKVIYGSFIFVGLLLGLGVIFLKYVMFNEINQVEDLENILPTKTTILGAVPLLKTNMEYSQLVVSELPKSILAEAMRKIRTNLSYIHPDYKTIAVSSSVSGEGKTFVALNLGGIIAMSGKRTILLDLDLRKPKVHLGFDVDNVHGMSSLIVGQSTLEDSIKHSSIEGFDFITAGPIPPNPSELILSKSFKNIVEELKELYDVIIIDNPPVGLVSDGVKNLTEADIPIYVFKSHYSKRNFANRVKELFEMQQLKNLNVILNGVQLSKRAGYGYGYGYGYGGYVDEADPTISGRTGLLSKLRRKK